MTAIKAIEQRNRIRATEAIDHHARELVTHAIKLHEAHAIAGRLSLNTLIHLGHASECIQTVLRKENDRED